MGLVHHTLALGPLDNRSYVVVCESTGEAAVLDIGFGADEAIALVRRLGVTVRWLLATHGHYDHVAGMLATQRAVGGVFAIHPDDRRMLELLSAQGAAFGFPPADPPAVGLELAHGVPVALGGQSLDVIHTPGHSPGGVCFRWGEHVWVGDTLFAGSVGRTDLPGGSFEALERSIRERLFPLGDGLHAYPGHGPATTLGRERRTNPFVGEGAGSA
jgi:hydroxyacylglutathione hydrolase